MGRRSDHTREELKSLMLNAAITIVVEQGFRGVTARKVAEQAGYTVGSLYQVFKNLDDLIVQLNEQTMDEILLLIERELKQQGDEITVMHALALGYARYASENSNRWRMVFEHKLPITHPLPESFQHKILSCFVMITQRFAQLFPQKKDEELLQAAQALWSSIHGICILSVTGKLDTAKAGNMEPLIGCLVDNFIGGLLASSQK